MTGPQAEARWELGELVHDVDVRCAARMRDWVTPLGLAVAQASALREMTGPMAMRGLAAKMGCEPSGAAIVIGELETLGLVGRRPRPADRRGLPGVLGLRPGAGMSPPSVLRSSIR